ncbi:MAG: VapC toxin family PIN domain ribonuclease [Bacteroidetes bacterium 4484_249]|nr:MAG: VapC toxin family PIN domain ribonuclease [Bacteroidetes bacterium 4484_249]
MILVDTSVWVDYFNGIINQKTNKLDLILSNNVVITGDIILTEILQGFRNDKDYQTAKNYLDSLYYYQFIDKSMSIKAAENFRFLKKKGITVRKTTDILIGTFCIEYNIPLLHNDKDFEPMEEYLHLKVI